MKYIITIIIIVIVVVAGLYLTGNKDWLGSSTQQIQNQPKPSPSGENPSSQPNTPPPASQASAASPALAKDLTSVALNFVILAKDFDTDVPFSLKGIWAQNDNNFYVEYKNNKGTPGQILVVKTNGKFIGKGYFSPSESGWVLQAGEGDLIQANAVFYVKNEQGWVRKN